MSLDKPRDTKTHRRVIFTRVSLYEVLFPERGKLLAKTAHPDFRPALKFDCEARTDRPHLAFLICSSFVSWICLFCFCSNHWDRAGTGECDSGIGCWVGVGHVSDRQYGRVRRRTPLSDLIAAAPKVPHADEYF